MIVAYAHRNQLIWPTRCQPSARPEDILSGRPFCPPMTSIHCKRSQLCRQVNCLFIQRCCPFVRKSTGRKKGLIPSSDVNRSRKPSVSPETAHNLSKDLGVRLDFGDPLSDAFTEIQTFLRERMQTLENDKMLTFVYLEKDLKRKQVTGASSVK